MTEYIFQKETNPICVEVGYGGWLALGEEWRIVDRYPIGTSNSRDVWGWAATFNLLSSLERKAIWQYLGRNENGDFAYFSDRGDYVALGRRRQDYRHKGYLFCGCGEGEIDCGVCCINCCGVGQIVLDKLS